jgi:hypothetical protein
VSFWIDDEQYDFPDVPTEVWLEAFGYAMPAAWIKLIPTWLPDRQRRRLEGRLASRYDSFDIDHLEKHALTVLGAVCGLEFHVAQRLIVAARSDWMLFDGWCAAHNLDPTSTHISRLCNIAYRLRLEACEKDSERYAVKARLWAPPEGTRASGRSWDDDPDIVAKLDQIESDAFLSMFG